MNIEKAKVYFSYCPWCGNKTIQIFGEGSNFDVVACSESNCCWIYNCEGSTCSTYNENKEMFSVGA